MHPKMCEKAFGIIPFSVGSFFTPTIVCVFPQPVCPYAKIVPKYVSFAKPRFGMEASTLKPRSQRVEGVALARGREWGGRCGEQSRLTIVTFEDGLDKGEGAVVVDLLLGGVSAEDGVVGELLLLGGVVGLGKLDHVDLIEDLDDLGAAWKG